MTPAPTHSRAPRSLTTPATAELALFLSLAACSTSPDTKPAETTPPNTVTPAAERRSQTSSPENPAMTDTTMTKATMIPMTAAQGRSADLVAFLRTGRDLVTKNEPDTPYWYALQQEGDSDRVAIFDLFPHQRGRDAHFGGDVASALAANAAELVRGGWNDGVVGNVQHYDTLATKLPSQPQRVTKATYIAIEATDGQADALAQFLTAGCEMVTRGEPQTLYWIAMRSEADDHRFVIFDLFADQAGREAHFAGDVAAALQANADRLIAKGWDAGVLANVVHFDVVAAK